MASSAVLVVASVWAQPFDPVVPLGTLDGQSGFRIDGAGPGGRSGASLAATGDFNGDGLVDLAIGAPNTAVTRAGLTGFRAGEVFVLFGGRGGTEHDFDLNRLRADSGGDGSLGYILQGEFYQGEAIPDQAGTSVANAGDINGDGIDDLLVGAIGRGTGFGENAANQPQGAAYLLFGRPDNDPMPPEFDLGQLLPTGIDNENSGFGVIFHGSQVGGEDGYVVAGIGDFNGDGRDDLFVGNQLPYLLQGSFAGGGLNTVRGESYVVYGREAGSPWPAEMELSELVNGGGVAGFAIKDETSATSLGAAAAGIGDFTGDGRDDLLLGAYSLYRTTFDPFDPGGRHGAAVIIPGRESATESGFGGVLDLAELSIQPTVHRLLGPLVDFVQVGKAVAGIGDINGDGRPDIAIAGLYQPADIPGQGVVRPQEADLVYVLFGRSADNPLPQTFQLINLLPENGGNGGNGFAIAGLPDENFGSAISVIGDVNGDGRSDLLLGASGKAGNARGGAYVVYGREANDSFPALFSISELGNGQRGFALEGELDGDTAGIAVAAAGDLNGDGSTDFLIGAPQASSDNSGSTYAVFGAGNDVKAFTVDGKLSRAWYDPARSGEGIMTDFGTLNGQPAFFGAWYTYLNGEQQWFAVGPVVLPAGATSFESDLILTDGGAFGDAFDPGLVSATVWGSVRITVDECDRLSWDYSSTSGSQTGNLDFIPLLPDTLGLPGCRSAANKGLVSALGAEVSGTYWNAGRAGEGVIIDIENRGSQPTAFVSWFTYANGVQQWLVGSGPVQLSARALIDIPMVVTDGGQFGSAFDPSQVNADGWGTVSLRFSGCDNAELEYGGQFAGGTLQSGNIELVRFNGESLDQPCQAPSR